MRSLFVAQWFPTHDLYTLKSTEGLRHLEALGLELTHQCWHYGHGEVPPIPLSSKAHRSPTNSGTGLFLSFAVSLSLPLSLCKELVLFVVVRFVFEETFSIFFLRQPRAGSNAHLQKEPVAARPRTPSPTMAHLRLRIDQKPGHHQVWPQNGATAKTSPI